MLARIPIAASRWGFFSYPLLQVAAIMLFIVDIGQDSVPRLTHRIRERLPAGRP